MFSALTRHRKSSTRPSKPANLSPLFEPLEPRLLLSTIVVTTTADGGAGSLRTAITLANSTATLDTIEFNIPGAGVHTIAPLRKFPAITSPLIIDGYTQPGASANTLADGNNAVLLIELDGENIPSRDGLTIRSGASTIRGLVINRFLDGIQISDAGGNIIEGNFIGTDPSGTIDLGNLDDGVDVNGPGNNLVGGTSPAARNVISGNDSDGIVISGTGATSNRVEGNFIGTTAAGLGALGNGGNGVRIANVSGNTIGGLTPGSRNVISANLSDGVDIRAIGNTVQGNFIGVDVTAAAPLGNTVNGVAIFGSLLEPSRDNLIGGDTNAARNVIAGNLDNGVSIEGAQASNNHIEGNFIGTNAAGAAGIGNDRDGVKVIAGATDNFVGAAVPGAGNVISGNHSDGIEITGFNTQVLRNFVGLSPDGKTTIPNGNNGIVMRGALEASSGNRIGSGTAAGRNTVSGNTSDGVEINGAFATNNTVIGNYIGTNPDATASLGNNSDGVKIVNASNNTIGGQNPGDGNVLSANGSDGLQISGASSSNTVLGNIIGLNAAGDAPLGNNSNGVRIVSDNNLIGGAAASDRNIISANTSDGIRITGAGNRVQGNTIGADLTGLLDFGNAANGVAITATALAPSTGNTIGGVNPGEGNLISANNSDGVEINGAQASGNFVFGNTLGLDANGDPLPNASDGVEIQGAINNTIGGVDPGQANTIAANTVHGVNVVNHLTTLSVPSGNTIRGNSIHDNGLLAINLHSTGVTPNDALDADAGPNDLQNFPLLDQATLADGMLHITGALNSTPNTIFTIDFYLNDQPDPSGNGEGRIYLDAANVTTNAAGDAVIDINLSVAASAGQYVSATATSPTANTSEFSNALIVSDAGFVLGDMDGSGVVDAFDVDDFELALADKQAYINTHPGLDPDVIGDIDASGTLDAFDVDDFELLLIGGGAAGSLDPAPAAPAAPAEFDLLLALPLDNLTASSSSTNNAHRHHPPRRHTPAHLLELLQRAAPRA